MRIASIIFLFLAVTCIGVTGWKTHKMQLGKKNLCEAVGCAAGSSAAKDWEGTEGNLDWALKSEASMERAFKELCLWLDLTALAVLSALVCGLLSLKKGPNKPPEAMAVKCPPSNPSQAPAMPHL